MTKFRFILPVLACFFAVTIAWTTRPVQPTSDLVWFEVDALGDPINSTQGIQGDQSPFNCPGGGTNCARALSISQGEVSLNSGSTSQYHINSGVDMKTDYDQEATKP